MKNIHLIKENIIKEKDKNLKKKKSKIFNNIDNATIVVTHYQRLLEYIVPDFVHVLIDGKIVKSGDKNLAIELEKKGYDWLEG